MINNVKNPRFKFLKCPTFVAERERERESKTLKCVVIAIAALIAISGILLFASSNLNKAIAESNSSNAASVEIAVSLSSTGSSDGTTTTLDRKVYHSGDEVVVTWKGATSGNDFIIPTSIKVDGVERVSMSELNKVDAVQTANVQYERRMGSAGTMTTYESLKTYLTTEHAVSLGTATVDTNVEVQYERVSPVYRMYNMITSEHLFSTNKTEYDGWVEKCVLDQDFWIGEGIDWLAPTTSSNTKTVHRLYNAALGAMGSSSHYYTADEAEMASLMTPELGWVDDGSDNWFMSGGTTAIYTCYNEALGSAHHYTSSKSEWQNLANHGWALEEDKNGTNPAKSPEGVFQCTIATNWSFSPNYYTVQHKLQNTDNTYSVAETQVVSGNATAYTEATAKSYSGYEPGAITQKKILEDNSTVVEVNYDRKTYTVTFDGNGVTLDGQISKTVKFGDKITAIATPNAVNGKEFKNWYYDRDCTQLCSFNYETMPAGNLILYADWTKGNEEIEEDTKSTVTVTFSMLGLGSNVTKEIAKGSKVERIADPTYQGYQFGGWYTDMSFDDSKKFNFETSIYENLTLYAYWIADNRGTTGEDGKTTVKHPTSGEAISVLVTYDHDGIESTPEESLPNSVVEVNAMGTIRVTAAEVATGRDVTVTLTDTFGVGIANTNVALSEASGKSRGWDTTDRFGIVKFTGYNKKETGDDGKAQPVNPNTGEVVDTTVTYDHDNDTSTPEVPLPGAKVEITDEGDINVTVPEDAKGKDVTVNAKDEEGNPLVNKDVIIKDTDGDKKTEREPGKTDKDGNAKFEGDNKGNTGEDGIAKVYDPSDGTIKTIKVTYDNDSASGTAEVALPGAKIEISGTGKVKVTVPAEAEGKDVTVNVKDDADQPLQDKDVSVKDASGSNRGDAKTDVAGDAKFPASKGTTDEGGKVNPLDPQKGEIVKTTITYDDDNDTSTPEVPLEGATVVIGTDGKMTVTLPEVADDKDVSINVKDKNGDPVPDKPVVLNKSDGTQRATGTTDANGDVKFDGTNKQTTPANGTVQITDPSTGKTLTITVTYDADSVSTTAEVALKDAKVEVTKAGKIKTTLPSTADGKDVTVNVKEGTTAVVGRDASAVNADATMRADKKTDDNGDAKFPASSGKTDGSGEAKPLDPVTKENIVTTVTYDHDYDSLTPQIPLEGAQIEVCEDGSIKVTLPAEADGKDVTVNAKDKAGNPLADRNVTALNSDGSERGTGKTDAKGNVQFDGNNKGTTGADGTVTVPDPSDGIVKTITVTYDEDGDRGASTVEVALPGAKVEIDGKGNVRVNLPITADGKDVTVNVKDNAGNAVKDKPVNVEGRGDAKTDEKGDAKFPGNKGTTDEDGNVNPLDPQKGEIIQTTIKYDHDGDSSTVEVPLEGAIVEVADDGTVKVDLPEIAQDKDVSINIKDKNGNPVADKPVAVTDADGTSRGEAKTDKNGDVKFLASNKGIIDGSGEATPVDPSDPNKDKIKVKVTYDNDDNPETAEVPLTGATVEANSDGTVKVTLPAQAQGKDVTVNIKDKNNTPIPNKTVSVYEQTGALRGIGKTDQNGDVKFDGQMSTTQDDGKANINDPSTGKMLTITVTYDHDNNSETAEEPVKGATLEFGDYNILEVIAPDFVKSKSATVTIKYGQVSVKDQWVSFQDMSASAPRATKQTDVDGQAKFTGGNSSSTGTDGSTTVTDPTNNNEKLTVTVKVAPAGTTDFAPLADATVEATTLAEGIKVTLPAANSGNSVQVKVAGANNTGRAVTLYNVGNATCLSTLFTDDTGFVEFTFYLLTLHLNGGAGVDSVAVYTGTAPTQPSNPARTGYNFVNWYTDATLVTTFDFSAVMTANGDAYAKWQNTKALDGYWLAEPNADDPEDVAFKSAEEIRNDVAAIKGGNAEITAEYQGYITNDTYHLYTPWYGQNDDGANAWVEFRVTAANTGGVSFQATHALPVAYSMDQLVKRGMPTNGFGYMITKDMKAGTISVKTDLQRRGLETATVQLFASQPAVGRDKASTRNGGYAQGYSASGHQWITSDCWYDGDSDANNTWNVFIRTWDYYAGVTRDRAPVWYAIGTYIGGTETEMPSLNLQFYWQIINSNYFISPSFVF